MSTAEVEADLHPLRQGPRSSPSGSAGRFTLDDRRQGHSTDASGSWALEFPSADDAGTRVIHSGGDDPRRRRDRPSNEGGLGSPTRRVSAAMTVDATAKLTPAAGVHATQSAAPPRTKRAISNMRRFGSANRRVDRGAIHAPQTAAPAVAAITASRPPKTPPPATSQPPTRASPTNRARAGTWSRGLQLGTLRQPGSHVSSTSGLTPRSSKDRLATKMAFGPRGKPV